MKKYVVYLFDGTTQNRDRDETTDWSNIVRLYSLLHQNPPKDGKLLDNYEDGVGCRCNEKILGSAAGKGLEKRIEESYYDLGSLLLDARTRGDELRIYVFGFSRGAYAARLFCELVGFCGVSGDGASYETAMRRLVEHDADSALKAIADGHFFPPPEVEMLGVFDTVAMTDYGKGVDISKLPDNVKYACHAMSYNERRRYFPLTRFAPGQGDVEEVWFVGSHTDVGGGYVTRGLADYSLNWMIDRAREHGLPIVRGEIVDDTAVHDVRFNDSTPKVQMFGLLTKKRVAKSDDRFHWSVRDERAKFNEKVPSLPPENMIAYTEKSGKNAMIA